jgi:hypothetical protein
MLAIWKIDTDEPYRDLYINSKSCVDSSGHCQFGRDKENATKSRVYA